MADNVNLIVNETIDNITINPSIIDEIVDINIYDTTTSIDINTTPNLTIVNVNQVTGTTNLTYLPSPTNGVVESNTGSDATIPLADTVNAGLLSPSEKTKLQGIATGAEVNVNADWNATSGDAQILNKPAIPSISGLATVTYVDTQDALKVDKNTAITAATKTKITYDAKGLVTNGVDATTADITDSLNKRYVTDANLTVIENTSGTNTGDNATNSQYSGLAASKQDNITLTTTGTSGAATLTGATLNIPQYSGATNLTTSQTSTNFTINSSTGDDAVVPLGNGTLAGATSNDYTSTEKTKLGKYPSTATNGKILQGNGTDYVEIDTPTGTTNLNYIPAPTIGTVTSSTGNSATIPLADSINAGLLSAAEKTKLSNTSGVNTGDQDLSALATTTYVNSQDNLKVDKIVGKGLSTNDYTTAEQTKLAGIAEGAEVNVNADWNATSGDAQILNKPIIPSGSGIYNATASGTDTYTATVSGVASYIDGAAYLIRFTNGNTTVCTLNINGLGAVTLYRNNDGQLIGGDIQNGGEMLCVYNSTISAFQCIGTSPNDIISYVTNVDSVTITKGQAVYAFGGTGDRMTVKRAYNTLDSTSAQTIGIVMSASIAANQKGIIITQGLLDHLSTLPTSTFADGDTIYLGQTAGTITNVKPYAPNHLVYLGIVTTASNGASGRMYVKVQNGYELDELHNVQAQNPTLKDTLYFDNTVSPAQWKTASIPTVLGYTPANDASVVHLAGDTMTGSLILNANPTVAFGAATKSYVDTLINGIDWKTAANAATTASLPTYTVSGSGQILTGTVTLGLIDGVTLTSNQRLLVKNETSTLRPNNGIYVVTQVNPFILTRTSDANTPALLAEATISISGGDTLSNTQWHCNPASILIVIGTTNISFAGIGSGTYSFSPPLIDTGSVISILDANDTQNGVVTTGIQTFAGAKTFTGAIAASNLSGTNTGDVTLANNSGLSFTSGQTLLTITPATITASTSNSVTTSTHTHQITPSLGFIGSGSAQYQVAVTGATPFTPTWTSSANIYGSSGLNALTYMGGAGLIKMTGSNTFILDGTAYAPIASPTFTGTVILPIDTSIGSVTSTEIGYLDNVTSAIQTQLDSKAPIASPTFTGTPLLTTTPTVGDNTTKIASTAFVKTAIDAQVYNITISQTTSFTTETTSTTGGYSQNGRNVMIQNSATSINITVNTAAATDFIASYTKLSASGVNITFLAGSGATLTTLSGTAIMSGGAGSTALLTRSGNIFYLQINNI